VTTTLRAPARQPARPAPAGKAPLVRRAGAGGVGNLALAGLTLASVVALSRLFSRPWKFLVPVAVVAVAVHLVAWACRRARLDLAPSGVAGVVTFVLTTSWVTLGRTTAYGIPWRGTYHALGPLLQTAADAYRTTTPPTSVLGGFVVAGAFGAAGAAFLGDWAAFRMQATTEACLPSFSLFVLSAALAQGHEMLLAAGTWLAALLVFLLVRQAPVDGGATAWFASHSRRGPATLLATGAAVLAMTLVGTLVVGPHLPGATVHPLLDWRRTNAGGPGRSTGSPLVDIKSRLHAESQQEVFTVKTSQPTYWRLTALDTFDGSGWSLDDTYRRTGTDLAPADDESLPAGEGPVKVVRSTFTVSALDSLWLPAAFRPARIDDAHGLSYSAAAASLISSKATSDGLSYTVSSDVPTATPALLAQSAPISPGDPAVAKYLQLPTTVPATVPALARQVTQGARSAYDEARMLQDYLRSPPFAYSLNVPADDTPTALVDFLFKTRAGFCQQFAASFAVLARELGLPTRVAVGFTQGDADSAGVYHVREDDAHAWPEVYFLGVGWIAFEPTPGRGSPDPSAGAITGVPPQQQHNSTTPTTQPGSPTTAPGGTTPPAASKTTPKFGSATPNSAGHTASVNRHHLLEAATAVAGAAVLWVLSLLAAGAALAARRRRRSRDPSGRITLAWTEAGEALDASGAGPRPWETPSEYTRRAATDAALPDAAALALGRLGAAVAVVTYSAEVPDEEQAVAAEETVRLVTAALAADRAWGRRVTALLDPRPVWRVAMSEWDRRRRLARPLSSGA
jgi:hypothetical protein